MAQHDGPSTAQWLETAGLGALAATFAAEDITPDLLATLDEADLRELGLTLGQRKRFRAALASGPPAVPVSQSTGVAALSGERRQVTAVFVDLVGSTDLSRRLDPEDMSDLLHRYQDSVSGTVARMGGHVDRFLGDGIVVFFGWPLAREDAVEQAVRAGLTIVVQVAGLDIPQGEALSCRVGIATGLVVVHPDGQVVGETPNLAARLQSIGTPGTVVASTVTADLTRGLFLFEEIPGAPLKGFPEDTRALVVRDARHGVTRFEARARHRPAPLVGRDAELDVLRTRWRRACAGEGTVVRIVGDAGIGKSRLLAGLKDMTKADDRFVFNYQCAQSFANVPLWPVSESLRQTYAFSGPATPEEHRKRLTERLSRVGNENALAPGLMAALIGVDIGPEPEVAALDARSRRSRTLDMLVQQVKHISALRPIQILLEDAHWADPTTLDYIALLMQEVPRLPVLVVVTTRGTEMLSSEGSVQMPLAPLGPDESRAMVAGLLDESTTGDAQTIDPDLLNILTARSEGVPLFLEELTRGLLLDGTETHDGPTSTSPATLPATLPTTLHDLLMARLDRLGPAKVVAQSASCIGRAFSVDLLSQTIGQSPAHLSEPLAQLTAAGILEPAPLHANADFVFYHALIRDAAYESLLFRDRQALHAGVLGALETRSDTRPELIAQHAEAAGDPERAGRAWLDAARNAADRWANKEAERLTTRALETIAQWPEGHGRRLAEITCRLTRGDALGAILGYAAAEVQENYEQACALAEATHRQDLLFQALRGLWNGIYNSGDFEKSLPLAQRMHAIARDTGALPHWLAAQRSLGSNYLSLNDFQSAAAAYRDCISRGKALPQEASTSYGELPVAVAHGMLSQLESFAGRHDTALGNALRMEEIARDNGHPLAINQALAITGIIRWLRGEPDLALAAAEEEGRLAEAYGYVHWKAHSDVMIGACACRLAGTRGGGRPDVDAGLARLARGITAWIGTGARSYAPVFYCYLAECALEDGRIALARKAVSDGLRLARVSGEFFALAELQRLHARLARPLLREGLLRRALATARLQGADQYRLRTLCDVLEDPLALPEDFRAEREAELSSLVATLTEHTNGPELLRARALLAPRNARAGSR